MIVAFVTNVTTSHYQCASASNRIRQTLHSQQLAAFQSSLTSSRTGVTLSDRVSELSRSSSEVLDGAL